MGPPDPGIFGSLPPSAIASERSIKIIGRKCIYWYYYTISCLILLNVLFLIICQIWSNDFLMQLDLEKYYSLSLSSNFLCIFIRYKSGILIYCVYWLKKWVTYISCKLTEEWIRGTHFSLLWKLWKVWNNSNSKQNYNITNM